MTDDEKEDKGWLVTLVGAEYVPDSCKKKQKKQKTKTKQNKTKQNKTKQKSNNQQPTKSDETDRSLNCAWYVFFMTTNN